MRDVFNKLGYNLEEMYFHKLNQELIQKLKSKREAAAAKPGMAALTTTERKVEKKKAA